MKRRRQALTWSIAMLLAPEVVTAAVFNVGAGDVAALTSAIDAANANGEADTINLTSSVYTLTRRNNVVFEDDETGELQHANGLPIITSEIAINGNGSSIVRDPGARRFRILHLEAGADLTLDGLTISGGRWRRGAGIHVAASSTSLTLNDCVVSDNRTGTRRGRGAGIDVRGDFVTLRLDGTEVTGNGTPFLGGGLHLAGNSLTADIVDSVIADNTTSGEGGGISLNGNSFDVTLKRTTVSANRAVRTGGIADGGGIGISGALGTLRILDSTIDGNEVTTGFDPFCCGGYGGGIANNSINTIVIKGSTISNNSVHTDAMPGNAYGGGIAEEAGSADTKIFITNSTISGNSVTSATGASRGGGIKTDGGMGVFRLRNVTMTNNSAGTSGGGIATEDDLASASSIALQNSILAGNQAPSGPDCGGASGGVILSRGYNLFGSLDGCTVNGAATGNTIAAPMLEALAANGGPTMTHLPMPGSPAIDTGNPATPGSGGLACEAKDQRGIARPAGAACDRGSTEQ